MSRKTVFFESNKFELFSFMDNPGPILAFAVLKNSLVHLYGDDV